VHPKAGWAELFIVCRTNNDTKARARVYNSVASTRGREKGEETQKREKGGKDSEKKRSKHGVADLGV